VKHALRSLPFARFARAAIAAAVLAGAAAGVTEAATGDILVNKAFAPTSITLGETSTVTVTLQNTSVTTAAKVTSFTDDIATMGGKATFASPNNLSTTCAGGTPTISGTVVSMKNGTIPMAPNVTTAGTCTVTFTVKGVALGNGINTIPVDGLQTDQGSNQTSASQTLQIIALPLTVAGSPDTNVLTTQTTTQSFTVTNPTPTQLTGGAFVVNTSSGSPYTLSNGTTTCGGSVAFSAFPATSGQARVTGLTIPPNGSCTITYTVSVPAGSPNMNVAGSLAASAVTTDQGLTNPASASARSYFWSGRPNTSKAFSPSTVTPGATTRMSVTIGNTLTTPLTNAGFTDNLPTGLTLDASPNPVYNANCGSPTVTGAGTSTFRMSGATIPGSTTLGSSVGTSSCTVTVTVDVAPNAPSSITNSIPAANFTNAQGIPGNNDANATLTVSSSGLTDSKAFSTGSVPRLTPVTVTLSFTNGSATAMTNGTFVDRLPQSPVPLVGVPSIAPTFSSCGTAGAQSVTFSNGNTVVSGSGLTVSANGGRCQVKFSVQFASGTSTTQTVTNTVVASDVTFTQGATTVHPTADISANLNTKPAFITKNYLSNAFGLSNDAVTVQGQIIDQAGPDVTDTNVSATFILNNGSNHNVKLAPSPKFTFGPDCPGGLSSGNIVIGAGGESFTVNIPTLNSNCTITYDVTNQVAGAQGQFSPGNSSYTSNQNGGTNSNGGQNSVRFSTTTINMNKVFVPNQMSSGAISIVHITLSVQPIISFPNTQANGVRFTDTLPSTLEFAPSPNVKFSAECQQPGQPQPQYSIAGRSLTASDISLEAASPAPCSVEFSVTSLTLGNGTNTLAAGSVTSASGSTNSQAASSSLSVVPGVGLQKAFLAGSVPVGGTDYMRLQLTNSSSLDLTGGTIADTMPVQLLLKNRTFGPLQPGDPVSCGGAIDGTVGSNVVTLSGLKVAPATNASTPGRCVVYVPITTTANAAPGTYINSIPPGGLVIGGLQNETPAAAPITITPPPPVTIEKTFTPSTINPNGTSVLTVTISNTASGAVQLTGMGVTDALPKGVLVAAIPNASTTCSGGTVAATAGSSNVTLAGATIAAGATCKVVATVTATTAGTYTNTIPVNAVTTIEGASNSAAATAVLTVVNAPPVNVTKVFTPTPIIVGGTSKLTVTIANQGSGAVALTGVALSDVLPSNVTVAATPHAATTCGPGTVTAGGASIALSGGTLAAGGECTFSADVTSSVAGTYLNTIALGTLTSAQGATNAAPATATLEVRDAPPIVVTKAFAPASVPVNGTSVLTVTVANGQPNAIALTSLAFNDALPAGTEISATPNASTTCGGSVTAAAGASSFALAGGAVGAGASCTVRVSVTGTTVGPHVNTIPAGGVTTAQGSTNATPATATLTVLPPGVNLSKTFSPSTINPRGTSVLTISIANTNGGAIALNGLALTDTLPAGVTIAVTPGASTTCGNGSVSATAGGDSVALGDGSVGAGATCTVKVNVTGTTPGNYTNTIPAGALTSSEGASNASPASAVLTIENAPDVTLSKAFSPASIAPGATSKLTVTVANTASGSVALSDLALTDTLPAGVTIGATPGAVTTCGSGTVSAAAGGASVALAGGSIGADATCTISVNVTSLVVGVHSNTIPASAVTSQQGATNAAPASADLTVVAPPVTITKAFAPAQINPHGTSQLSITISNTATGAIALTAMALTDSLPAGVNVASPADASTTCGTGTVDAKPGDTNLALAGGSVGAGASCTITVNVTSTSTGSYVNTIPAGALTTSQGASNAAPASATLTVVTPPNVALIKTFRPILIVAGGSTTLRVTISNTAAGAGSLTGVAFGDTLPSGLVVAPVPNASTTCGAGSVTAVAGAASYSLADGSVAAGASCSVSLTVTAAAPGAYVNVIPARELTSLQGATNGIPALATLIVTAAPPVTLAKAFAPSSVVVGGTSVLTLTIGNAATGAVALTNLAVSDALPAGVQIAPSPNASTTCGAGTVTATAGATTFALVSGSVGAAASCTVSVTVEGVLPGSHVNTVPANSVSSTQGATNSLPASATLTVSAPDVTLSKAFTPAIINPSGISTLTISVANTGPNAVNLSALGLADTLPANVRIATLPDASTTCGSGTVSAAPGGSTIDLTGGSVAASATCTVSVNVTSATLGAHVNTIPAGNVTSAQGATNASAASATLTVENAPNVTLSKTFTPSSIVKGRTSVLEITVANQAAGSVALTGLALSDTLPANVTIAATPNASTTCGAGSVTAAAGGTAVALSGGSVGAAATCTISVDVTSATLGLHLNTIPAGAVSSTQGATNGAPAAATLSVVNPPDVTLSKAFAPATINPSGISTLTISVANTAAGSIDLSALALSDALPAGVTIAASPGGSTTCGSGTVTAVAGGTSVSLSGGSVASGATCTVSVNVTSVAVGAHLNTIPAGNVTTAQGASNGSAASATLTVENAPAVAVTKTFTPASIIKGATSVLQITISNRDGAAVALTGLALTDTLPAGVTIATTPNASTTCGPGTVTAAAGGPSVALSGGAVAANATCTISVQVTSTTLGAHLNTIPAGALTSTQGATNPNPAPATLTVINAPGVTLSKTFTPASIVKGGTSALRITVSNLAAGSVALTGVALADSLPAGVTIAATPNASTTCGAGTVTAAPGGAGVSLSGGSVGAGATCTITVDVTSVTLGAHLNTIPAGAFTSAEGATNAAPASATLTVINAPGVTLSKAFTPPAIVTGGQSLLTITVANTASGAVALTALGLSDALPAGVTIAASPGGSTTCGAGSVTAVSGGTSVALSGGSVGASATCTVSVNVTSSVLGTHVNTIPPGNVASAEGATNAAPATAGLVVFVPHVTLSKVFTPGTIHPHGTSTMTISIANTAAAAIALTGVSLTDSLPSGVNVAPVPNASTTCGAGTVDARAGDTNVSLGGGSVAAGATCTISVNVTSGNVGTYVNTIPAGALASTQGASNTAPATATLTVVNAPNVTLSKAFTPAAIVSGGISTLTVTIANPASGQFPLTGIALADTLPSGVKIAAAPNASTTCGAGTVSALAGGTSFGLSGGSVGSGASCTVSVNVTSATPGDYLNTIPAGEMTSLEGATNANPATATLTVRAAPPVTLTKAFAPSSIALDGTSVLTISIANTSAGSAALTSLAVTDALPAGVEVAATPGASTTCGSGIVDAHAGASSIGLSAGAVAADATCTVSVRVTGTTAGAHVNTIPSNAVSSAQGATNTTPATATLTVLAPGVTLSKAFAPSTIAPSGISRLTISVANTASGAIALTAMSLTDTLPSGVTIATAPAASTTCGSGAVTAPAGGGSVALTGGSVGAGATCTIAVNVTSVVVGAHTNTIPAGAVATAQGASNAAPATAVLTVENAPNVTLSKAFSPAAIFPSGVSRLTISVANTASGALALSAVSLTDTLPAGVTVATTPNASTTCGGGTVTAVAGGGSVALGGGSVAAGATCTISVNVTSTVAGVHANTIPAGAFTSAQGATNATPATADLTVNVPHVTLGKVFTPGTIHPNGTSTLTISIGNTATGAIALTGLSLTDALPAGVNVAAVPNASTTCGAGTVDAKAGAASVALASGSVGAGATCTLSVNVTSASAGTYVNTIPAGTVTSTQGASNTTPATATLSVVAAPNVTIAKTFSPAKILRHGVSQLTISIVNAAPGAAALTALGLGDSLPTGVNVAAVPNASTTCGSGTVSAPAGATHVALSGGAVAAAATCTITVDVTAASAGSYVNTIPASDVTSAQGATNTNAASATLTVEDAGPVTVTKAFSPSQIIASGVSVLTITVANTDPAAIALTGAGLTDALPTGVEVAPTPNASTTCPLGTVRALPGTGTVVLSGAQIAAAATCTVTVSVTAVRTGTFVNTIPAGAVTNAQGASNTVPATATLTAIAPGVTLSKAFSPASIAIDGTSLLTISIANTQEGAVALTALGVTDTLPRGVEVAAAPNATTTCGGAVAAPAGGSTIVLSGGNLGAAATCTVSVQVTGKTTGTHVNVIPVGSVTSAQGTTNTNAAAATLTVLTQSVTLTKTFEPQTIAPDGVTRLTISVANTGPGAIALSALSVTDTLPANVTVAASPSASTTCGAGTVGATPGGTSVSLTGGSVGAGATCTISVNATASEPGTYTNTIPAGSVSTHEGASNGQPAVAVLQLTGQHLSVTKTASSQVVTSGDRVNYAIVVSPPPSTINLGKTTIVDQLPQYEIYAPGTSRINGHPQEPVVAGRTLTWTLPGLPAQVTIVYSTAIGAGVPQNTTLTNTVNVTSQPAGGGRPLTGIATASVMAVANSFGNCYPITGRVYEDLMGSGRFEDGDKGVAGVRIYMEDGESVMTDEYGRYNFPCVRPGMHALRLDETSLPDGVLPYGDHNIDSERSTRRLIHGIFDDTIIQDINFAVKGPAQGQSSQQQRRKRHRKGR
jgi:uncharacterized repeat protein (TIGR01451 family)